MNELITFFCSGARDHLEGDEKHTQLGSRTMRISNTLLSSSSIVRTYLIYLRPVDSSFLISTISIR